ncbi:lymphocyte activation gene 3 protein [Sphaerodactylus townsendi]|uniref:lymphocyte activation gene 3 protein n=1 Tax=Sphaerodactylus townsendi TaxID=933632 RepID=UPI0020262448|nr:lymphocyte activation gene 3 protein [Sphaerodactylus townsendi]
MRLIFLSWSVALNLLTTSARNVSYEAGEPKRVWAEEGGRAVLPCYLNPQKLESSLGELYKRLSIRWEWRGRSSTQVHHMVLQVAASGLKTRARSMMPRASVQDKDFLHGDFSLQIKPATREDVGRYSARVKYGSKAHHCELKLDVVSVSANPPGPLLESESVKLTCSSTLPEKPIKIQWFSANHLVKTSGRFWPAGQSLFISRSISSDSGPWVCELTYAGGERVSVTHHLQVLGFAGPTWPVVYAATGTNIYLPCILNFNPLDYDNSKVAVRWSHVAGDDLKAKSNQHQGTNKNLALYLPAVGPDSAGQYFCAVSINGTTISKNVTLVIMTVIPSIEGPVLEGSHLVLTCNLSHAPGKVHFQWKWLGPEPSNSSKAAFKSSEHLTTGWIREFSKVSPEDSGIWECSIHSAEGRLGSVQYHLEIAGAQVASPAQNMMPEEITYGLISFLFALVVSVAVLILLWHRTRSLNIPALDRLVAAAHLRKEFKDAAQKEKVLQTEP